MPQPASKHLFDKKLESVAFCRIPSHLREGALGGVRWRGGRSEIGHAEPPLASLGGLYLTLSELSS